MSLWTPTASLGSGQFAIPPVPVRCWSVDEYHAMLRAGILNEEDPIELLDGWLVSKMTKTPPHRIATRRVRKALERVVPVGWYVDSQEPITLSSSEPEGSREHSGERIPRVNAAGQALVSAVERTGRTRVAV